MMIRRIRIIGFFLALSLLAGMGAGAEETTYSLIGVANPEEAIFWEKGYQELKKEPLDNGAQLFSWPEAPNAALYYLVVCVKGFGADTQTPEQTETAWAAEIWAQYADVEDMTERMLSIIDAYDASLWYPLEENQFEYAENPELLLQVYAAHDIPYAIENDKISFSEADVSILENQYVFYVPGEEEEEEVAEDAAEATGTATPAPVPTLEIYTLPDIEDPAAIEAGAGAEGDDEADEAELSFIGMATVTFSSRINIREGDHEAFAIIGKADPGQVLPVLAETERGWYAVLTMDLEIGYVSAKLVEFTPMK